MKINLIAIGKNMPEWVNNGFSEYAKRLPKDFQLNLIELPLIKRTKNINVAKIMEQEAELILQHVKSSDFTIALDEHGKQFDTKSLALQLQKWRENYQAINLIIGGPDGLAKEIFEKANFKWSLSNLTLPHPLVRIVVAEQIYRAWSILQNHPYHRN